MQYDKLKSSTSFAQLRRRGSSYVAPAFVILVHKNNDEANKLKIGFTASKKIGNAIKRAKSRRRLRAALDEIPQTTLDNFDGCEFNIVSRVKSLDVDFEKLVFYFKKTLENIEKDYSKNAKKD